jgi:predicted enzyme related to lactoylglutathione lyase
MKIGMTGIIVNDPAQAFKFYTEVLGFKEHTFMPEYNLAIVTAHEDPNGTSLLLSPNDNPVGKAYQDGLYQQNIPAIVFVANNVQAEYERLVSLGVKFISQPTKTEWGIAAIFDDTCGNYIQLHQMT